MNVKNSRCVTSYTVYYILNGFELSKSNKSLLGGIVLKELMIAEVGVAFDLID